MKLKRLQVNNFVGVPAADVEFDRPVTLFVGQNNQGKSSIKDAILFALTGKARALTKFKDVKRLSHGNNGMAVDLNYDTNDGTPIDVHRTPSSVSTAIDERAVLRYCLNPAEFIQLPAKDRAKVLAEVLGGGMDEVIQAAIVRHIGKVNNTLVAELKGSGVNMLDIDAFRKEVVECRRSYKRILAELPDKPPLKGDYELEQDYEVDKDAKDVEALAERITKGADIIAAAKRQNELKVELVEVNKRLEKVKALIQKVPKLPEDYDENAAVYCALIEGLLNSTKSANIQCPLVPNSTHKRELLEARHKELAEYMAKYQDAVTKNRAIQSENNAYEMEYKHLASRQRQLNESIKPVDLKAGSENKLKKLQDDRDAAQARIANYRRFAEAMDTYTEAGNRRSSLEALITECDRIDDALKDGGPVKAAIAAGGRKLPINESLLRLWGMEALTWQDNGEISLGDVPIEYASESEKYRAASVMALALSEVSGIRIAAIDGFEILVSGNANAFFKVVNELDLNNVLVFQSTDKDWSQVNNRPDWLRVFQVEQGKVRPV